MNYDITFCSKKDCSNKECKRNQSNISNMEKVDYFVRYIWISEYKDCEYWKE